MTFGELPELSFQYISRIPLMSGPIMVDFTNIVSQGE
jgi:hypothetical protein